MDFDFDVAVIGSGPGGQRAAVQAAKLGRSVIVIEKENVGGACLHWGTIPSKTLREAALTESTRSSNFFNQVMKRKTHVVSEEVKVIQKQLSRNAVEYLSAHASFLDPHTLLLEKASGHNEELRARNIIIATGTRPRRPEDLHFKENILMDSDTVLSLREKPGNICIIGAGVIGCEYASIFLEMGVPVTLVDRRADLLRGIDREIVKKLEELFEANGLNLRLNARLGQIDTKIDGVQIEVNGENVGFESALYCMGRLGNVETLKLEAAGLKYNERNQLVVNQHFQTEVPHIYAVGDVIGAPSLAASAYEQGRLAACHCLGESDATFTAFFPYGIYTIPEISSVGAQEDQLIKDGVPYVSGVAHYKELARGKILDDEGGFLKLLFHRENKKLLGAHIIGSHATELIHLGQMALSFDATIDQLLPLVFNYPTLAEAYKVACLNAHNKLR